MTQEFFFNGIIGSRGLRGFNIAVTALIPAGRVQVTASRCAQYAYIILTYGRKKLYD
jgi:hypothetical protein